MKVYSLERRAQKVKFYNKKNVIWDPRFGFAEKCKKMLYLTFLIIKKLYPANFWGTFKNPEHASFGIVYQLLDSIVNLCTN